MSNDTKTTPGSWSLSITNKGEYKRKDSSFRNWIKADGSTDYTPEKGRYHLYVSYACPWACRTLALLQLKGLTDVISHTVVDWYLDGTTGWRFNPSVEGSTPDPVHNFDRLRQVYELNEPNYSDRVTVPVLFDKKTDRIVNNESSEIIIMLNKEFNELCATKEQAALDLYPEHLRAKIDEVNEWVYNNINNGVYKAGFATSQEAYETAFDNLFVHLDKAEEILSKSRYITGNQLTLADIRLFMTLIRFDAVYVLHFKCNLRQIKEYPNLQGFTKELYQMPALKATVNFTHIKNHYMKSHKQINPHGVVAKGPILDLDSPHGRDHL